MCSPATCSRCGKVTYAGCGMHVDQVMRGVPEDRRCSCDASTKSQSRSRWSIFR